MRKFLWSFSIFFCLIFSSYSQTKGIEKGTYLSTNKGQKIKLNLLDNNKYELVFYSGDYKIKGDSLSFFQTEKTENSFNLTFKNDKKAQKIKIKFLDPSYYSFYIGTQSGSEPVQYQRISDIKTKVDPDWTSVDADFEIDRTDFLYLVYEGYETESKIYKYALPKDVSEVTIKYELDAVGDLNISGFFDRKTNQLMISEQTGKNPIAFSNEKDALPVAATTVKPIESQSVSNWTYPGKEAFVNPDNGVAVDSSYVVVDSAYAAKGFDFKFKIENNLKSAIASNKNDKTKFLVVSVDSKNTSAKADFDAFIKDHESQLSDTMYDEYHPEYDLFNYYLATADDKKWLKTNKITDSPTVLVLDSNGNILASAKSNLLDKRYQFYYYDELYKKLQRTERLISFNKTLKNKKATDADLILAFNKIAALEIPYDYDITTDENDAEFKFVNTTVDKKEVAQTWKKLVESHQKDKQPNMYLVETILREIKNQGFSKQFLPEDRVLNDTDFLAIDYLIKHYDAIDAGRLAFTSIENETHTIGALNTEIANALEQNKYIVENEISGESNQSKVISVYKKLIAAGKGSFECYRNYFAYLAQTEDKDGSNTSYLKEFSTYFNTNLLADNQSPIERLDTMFTALDSSSSYTYDGWNSFKEYHSNFCNDAAWAVVLKPANSNFVKSAITWSEYSLAVTKNNPYYLDTLAQLYYKDGQKEKAIATHTLAVKYLNADVEEQTASEIKETLTKMQNGTY